MKLCLLEPGLHAGERIVQVTKLAQVSSRGEAEESRGRQDGPQREALLGARDEGRFSSSVLTGALEALDAEQIAMELRAEHHDQA